ncbi:hypothetical protein RMATCC62417_03151 [Rhizopus microsporus]|nr:hypothetical protein RMATCC62417_03151 [Rhizopus microsporus]
MSTTREQLKINFISGATGLSFSYACMHPLDTIKTRIQAADPNVPREVITAKLQIDHYKTRAGQKPNAAYVIRQTLLEDGPKGLFRGFWAIAARDSPFMIILLYVRRLKRQENIEESIRLWPVHPLKN